MNIKHRYTSAFLVVGIFIIAALTIQNIKLNQEAASLRALQMTNSRSQTTGINSMYNPTTNLERQYYSCESCTVTINEKEYTGARINGGTCNTGYKCASSGSSGSLERVINYEQSSSGPIPVDLQNYACTSCTVTINEKEYSGARIEGTCYTGYTCSSSASSGESRATPKNTGTVTGGMSLMTDMWKDNLANPMNEVLALQNFLINNGYLAEGNATGKFGPATREAVIKFQVSRGLPGTGYVGEKTRALINGQM